MAKLLVCTLLLCLLAFQVEASRNKRDIILPKIDIFNPAATLQSFLNVTKQLGNTVTNAVGQAIASAGQLKNELDKVVNQTINDTETKVAKLVQGVEAAIKDRLANGLVASTVKAGVCATQGTQNATAAGADVVKNSVGCITNQTNAFLQPMGDLINKGQRALFLGYNIFQNVSTCFPNGFNVSAFDLLPALACAAGKIGPLMTEVSTIVTSLASDVKHLQTAFATTRDAIVVCPREQLALLVIRLGNVIGDFGKCMDAIIPDATSTSINSTASP